MAIPVWRRPSMYALELGDLIALGRKIREQRERLGLSQKALSAASGLSDGYIGELENYKGQPSVGALLRLCRALGVGPDVLLSWKKEE